MYTLQELKDIVTKGLSALNFNREPSDLYNPLGYMISIGGKRLRPVHA